MPTETYTKVLKDGTIIGDVPGIARGTFHRDRQALHDAKLHRGIMQGIAPHGSSVVLSGGYPDDQDLGDVIIYTGEGGRDKNTHKQIADQTFTGGNACLADNHIRGIPVRVQRHRKYAKRIPPEFLYRYDGLYRVAQVWRETGRDGFKICRFRLEQIIDTDFGPIPGPPSPLPPTPPPGGNPTPGTKVTRVTRVIRDTEVSDYVKTLHDYTCQICGTRIVTPSGPYAEGCHIKPIGRPHCGPDVIENLLCLCPNCHVEFDEVGLWINENLTVGGTRAGKLRTVTGHRISADFTKYHRSLGR